MEILYFAILFFLAALIYSSIGFGGGSTYTAILAGAGLDFRWIRFLSLFCNILVTGGNFTNYYKSGLKAFVRFWSFLLLSIPFAYLGGLTQLSQKRYLLILGVCLSVTSILMICELKFRQSKIVFSSVAKGWIIAMVSIPVGFLAGVVGIGGGVFLAPILHLIKWDSPKQIAAVSSIFIFLNSIAGIVGQWQVMENFPEIKYILVLGAAVLAGGTVGSYISVNILSEKNVKIGTGLLIGIIGIRLIIINM